MSDALIGEIRPFAGSYAPYGWLECNGQAIPMYQYQALLAVIGYTYGYSTTNQTFNVPNIQGTVIVGTGQLLNSPTYYALGIAGGAAAIAISSSQSPAHTHTMNGAVANQITTKLVTTPNNTCFLSNPAETATSPVVVGKGYFPTGSTGRTSQNLAMNTLNLVGGNTSGSADPHSNMQPTLTIKYCICAIDGEFPPRP